MWRATTSTIIPNNYLFGLFVPYMKPSTSPLVQYLSYLFVKLKHLYWSVSIRHSVLVYLFSVGSKDLLTFLSSGLIFTKTGKWRMIFLLFILPDMHHTSLSLSIPILLAYRFLRWWFYGFPCENAVGKTYSNSAYYKSL